MKILLTVKDLFMAFGGLVVLSKLNFSIAEGKINSIIGPNGAGKTTVFNILSGLLKPQSGLAIWREKYNLISLRPHEICSLGIGRTFQNLRLFPEMTVLENVMIGLHTRSKVEILRGIFQSDMAREEEDSIMTQSMKILEEMRLQDRGNDIVKNLPYGKQRLVEIARAIVAKPALLLLDEPCAGLNRKEKEDLKNTVQQIKESGTTVLLVEHDMKVVMDISDKLIVLDHGEKIFDGVPIDARSDPGVISAYLGRAKADA